MVNIFTDLYYLTFVQELNKSLSGWQPTVLPNSTCLHITLTYTHITHLCFLPWILQSVCVPPASVFFLGTGSAVPLRFRVILTHADSRASLVYASATLFPRVRLAGSRAWLLCFLEQF